MAGFGVLPPAENIGLLPVQQGEDFFCQAGLRPRVDEPGALAVQLPLGPRGLLEQRSSHEQIEHGVADEGQGQGGELGGVGHGNAQYTMYNEQWKNVPQLFIAHCSLLIHLTYSNSKS
jgi:hypothetical protein